MRLKSISDRILPVGVLTLLAILFVGSVARFFHKWIDPLQEVYPGEINLRQGWDGSLQEDLGKWFTENFYGYSVAVGCRNQIKYSLFHDGSGGWICGKERYLFSSGQVERYLGKEDGMPTVEECEEFASKVLDMQTALEEAGKEFVYLLTPNKAEIYPEYLPWYEQVILKHCYKEEDSAHARLIRAFDKHGIHYYDTTKDIMDMKEEAEFDVFAKTGHHWTFTACAMEMNQIFEAVSPLTPGIDYPQINVVGLSDELCHYDMDIINTQNVWVKHNEDVRYQSPILEYPEISDTKVYWFGTSYGALFTIAMYQDVNARAFDRLAFQQYFTGLFVFDENGLSSATFTEDNTPEDIKVMDNIWGDDLIVMEQQADSGIYPTHVKFVDYVTASLRQEKAQ